MCRPTTIAKCVQFFCACNLSKIMVVNNDTNLINIDDIQQELHPHFLMGGRLWFENKNMYIYYIYLYRKKYTIDLN